MKSSVLVTCRLPSAALDALEKACQVDLHTKDNGLSADELRERVHDKEGLVCVLTDQIDQAVFDAGPNLRIVANVAVGYNNIDLEQARRRGVVVTNTPDVLTGAVAEFTWGLILAISRRIAEGDRVVRAGRWPGWALDYMLGTELRGKQLGIIGAGRIGRAVAAMADAFSMQVVFTDVNIDTGQSTQSESPGSMRLVSLDELLGTSDVVSLHVPLTVDTRHLIDRQALARMKQTAYLVNTSRGPIVDEEALVWALGERQIAGAALDVYEQEPTVHPGLLSLDTAVLIPHLGSATRETRTAMAQLAVSNVVAVLAGKPPLTAVLD